MTDLRALIGDDEYYFYDYSQPDPHKRMVLKTGRTVGKSTSLTVTELLHPSARAVVTIDIKKN